MLDASLRPQRRDGSRSRLGCTACRNKRRKCDERRPKCGRCLASNGDCVYQATFEFRDATLWAANKVAKSRGLAPCLRTPANSDVHQGTNSSDSVGLATSQEQPAEFDHQIMPDQGPPVAENPWIEHQLSPMVPRSISSRAVFCARDLRRSSSLSPPFDTFLGSHIPFSPCLWEFDNSINGSDVDGSSPLGTPAQADTSCLGDEGVAMITPEDNPILPPGPKAAPMPSSSASVPFAGKEIVPAEQHFFTSVLHTPNSDCDEQFSTDGQSVCIDRRVAQTLKPDVRLPIPISPPALSVVERSYLAHFVVFVMDKIPVRSEIFCDMINSIDSFRWAAMALAAANLANLEGVAVAVLGQSGRTRWAPSPLRLRHAQLMRRKATAFSQAASGRTTHGSIFTELLLTWLEAEIGPLTRFCQAVASVEDILVDNWTNIITNPNGQTFLQSFLYLRAMVRPTVCIYRPSINESHRERHMMRLLSQTGHSHHLVELLASDSLAISTRIFICRVMSQGHGLCEKLTLLRKASQWFGIMQGLSVSSTEGLCEALFDAIHSEDDCFAQLDNFTRQVEACERFSGIQFPDVTMSNLCVDFDYDQVVPIRTNSHEETMQYAIYAFAYIMADTALIREQLELPGHSATSHENGKPERQHERWLILLLRLAAGLDPQDCVRRNAYRTGIARMVWMAVLRCSQWRALGFVDNLYQRFAAEGVPCEDVHFPLTLARLAVKAVEKEVSRQRIVYLTTSTHGPLTEKADLWSYQPEEHIIVLGQDHAGKYFSEHTSLRELEVWE